MKNRLTLNSSTFNFFRGFLVLILLLSASTTSFGQYCTPSMSSGCSSRNITNFTFNTINNSTPNCNSTNGYSDFTNQTTSVNRGCPYNYSITRNTNSYYLAFWIDYNGDGDFADANEKIFSNVSGTTTTGSVTIPINSFIGTVRMRAISQSSNPQNDGCGNSSFGEIEDYTLTITPEFIVNAGPDQSIACANSTTLAGNDPSPGTGQWSVISGSATIANPTAYNSAVSGLGAGSTTLRWSVTNGSCTLTDDVIITRSSVFSNAGQDQVLCADNTTMAGNNPTDIGSTPPATGMWTTISGTGSVTTPTLYNSPVTGLGIGDNLFVWTVSDASCAVTDTIKITYTDETVWTGLGAAAQWTDPANWTFGVPISCVNVVIPATANDPTLSTTTTVNKLKILSGATLTIANAGQLSLTDSLTLNGTLDNTGKLAITAGKGFKMGATGHYIHAPTNAPTNVSSANIFVNGEEDFDPLSTLTIKSWYSATIALYTDIQGDVGNVHITPNTGTAIYGTGTVTWYQGNLLQDHIKGDLVITKARFILSPQPPIGGINTDINLVVSGEIIINHAETEFTGLYHTTAAPTLPSSTNVNITATTFTVNNGSVYLSRNNNNGSGGMTGDLTLNTTNGLIINTGLFVGAQSQYGVSPGTKVTINSSIHTKNASQFIGARGIGITTDVELTGVDIVMDGTSIIRGQEYYLGPNSGDFAVTGSNLTINGGVFTGHFSCTGTPTYNFGNIVLADSGTTSVFQPLYGGNSTLSAPVTLNGNNLSVEGAGSVFNFNGFNAVGNVSSSFTGNIELSAGKIYFTNETSNSIINTTGNVDISGGELSYFSNIGLAVQNSGTLSLQVDGDFNLSGGTFEFDKFATNTGTTRSLIVKGDFTHSAGIFRGVKDDVSTVTFNGNNHQTISGSIATVFRNVVFNNPQNISVDTFNLTIENNSTITAGIIILNSSDLIFANAANAIGGTFDATKMIVTGNNSFVHKKTNATGSFLFPLGDTNSIAEYSPITINVTAATFAVGSEFKVNVKDSIHPNNANTSDYLSRYWQTSSTGITAMSADITSNYAQADVVGTEAEIAHGTWSGALPWEKGAVVDDLTNTLTFTGATALNDYSGITLDPPTATITGDNTRCETGDSLELTANAQGDSTFTYSWSPTTGLGHPTSKVTSAAPSVTTDYTVTVTDGNGIEGTSAIFTVTVTPAPASPTVTTPQNICQDATASPLTASGTNLIWYSTNTGDNPTTTAPTPNTSVVGSQFFYVRDSVGSCKSDTVEIEVIVDPYDDASFDYNGITQFCETGSSAAANVTGLAGGTFTGNAGLTINGSDGVIDLATSGIGTYKVYYTTNGSCPNIDSLEIEIITGQDASFSYTSPQCENAANILPTFTTGTPTGTFSITNGGSFVLADAATGEVNIQASGVGTEYIIFTIPAGAGCNAVKDSFELTINAKSANPTVSTPVTYCQNATATPLTATGSNLLWYTALTGGTGDANAPTPATNVAGTFSYYATQSPNGCESDRELIEVVITPLDDASFNYNGVTQFCKSGSSNQAIITGITGGTFSGSTGLIINASNGIIDLANSPLGTHNVSYSVNATCPNTETLQIEIINLPDITFTYASPFCRSDVNPFPTFNSGNHTGVFSSQGGINFVSPSTGEINLQGSTTGTELVYFTRTASPGCAANQESFSVSIDPAPAAPIVSSPIAYCIDDTPSQLSATGTALMWYTSATGGTGSATAPTPSTIAAGTTSYFVSQSNGNCESVRSEIEVSVYSYDDPTFAYSSSLYTQDQNDPTPTITGLAGGTFSGNNGIVLNATTGEIDLSASTIGTYDVKYVTNGNCPDSLTLSITIDPACQASFTYPTPVCLNGTNPIGTILAGTVSGTYTSSSIIIQDPSTGEIDLSTASPGTHKIYYTLNVSGACNGVKDSFDITLNATPVNPGVTTPINYCVNDQASQLTASGNNLLWYNNSSGGTGISTAPTPSTATPGTFFFYVSQTANGCESTRSQVEVVVDQDNPNFAYAQNTFCQNSPNPSPTIWGTPGGTFSASLGMLINSSTGQINMTLTPNGSYTVTYTTNGTCPHSKTVNIDIVANVSANFSYASPFCKNDNNPIPTIPQGSQSGSFGSQTATFINNSTGKINLATSAVGTHRIYNYVAASGTCGFAVDSFDIVINATPAKPTGQITYTYCQGDQATQLSATGSNLSWFTSATGGTGNSNAPTPSTVNAGVINYFVSQTVNSCESSLEQISVTVNQKDNPSFTYTSSSFCQTGTNPTPSIIGTTSGTFSSSAGLILNSTTGEINLVNSTVGFYSVKYLTTGICPDSSTQTINITSGQNAGFTYTSPLCMGSNNPNATLNSGASAGTFSSNTLSFTNSSTGTINMSSANSGTHRIYNSLASANGCAAAIDSFDLNINPATSAPIINSPIDYCISSTASPLSATGVSILWYNVATGGTGSSSAPTPSTSAVGGFNFYVSQSVSGCESQRATIVVNVHDIDNANVSYPNNAFCVSENAVLPSYIATPGGTFSSPNGLIVNANTGEIDFSTSDSGTFDLLYQTNSYCPNSTTQSIQIDDFIDGSFYYAGNYCQGSNGQDPMPTFIGTGSSGTFSSSPAGLTFLNISTGQIDLNNSSPGSYDITNTTQPFGACPSGNHTSNIIINPEISVSVDDLTINCGGVAKLSSIVNITGGAYTWTPGGQVNSTIYVNPVQTTQYTVLYDAGNGCKAIDSAVVTVEQIEVYLDPFDDACETHPAFALFGGNPAAGTYSGQGITNNIFYPSQANLGNNTITYTYQNGSCSSSTSQIIYVDQCLGFTEQSNFTMSISPNPNNGDFNVSFSENVTGEYLIFNAIGQKVAGGSINSEIILNINVVHLSNGLYNVVIRGEKQNIIRRIQIQH
jgi:hypothetical protein